MSETRAFSYVLPLRRQDPEDDAELIAYLRRVAEWSDDVIVVDGSPPDVFREHHQQLGDLVTHVPPDPARTCLMGKVAGVLTGVDLARHERVVVADDDVRYDEGGLTRLVGLLDEHDLVRPQNYFSPLPWHATWDTARTLLNRSLGADYPGTLGVRRSAILAGGGYDGNVMFENLELIRTVRARGGRAASPLDLFVRRLPPTDAHFWGQRTRQAYDDFAIPLRMALWLSIVPGLSVAVIRRRRSLPLGSAVACMLLAERGRRRCGGRAVFSVRSSLLAPGWVLERAICAWLAVLQRVRFGGVRYGDSVIRVAAHSERELRRRTSGGAG